MEKDFQILSCSKVSDYTLTGTIKIAAVDYPIIYSLNVDESSSSVPNLSHLIDKSANYLDDFDANKIDYLLEKVAKEVTEAAYVGIDCEYTELDILKLKKDLKIERIDFYDNDMVIFFKSNVIFTRMTISVQVDYETNIDEVIVS